MPTFSLTSFSLTNSRHHLYRHTSQFLTISSPRFKIRLNMSASSQPDQPEKFSILSLFPTLVDELSRYSSAKCPDHTDAVDDATEMMRCLLIASKRFSINARFLGMSTLLLVRVL